MKHPERVHVGPLALDPLTMREAVDQICLLASARESKARIIATANAQFAQIAKSNRRFRDILLNSDIVVADGMSLVAASWLLERPLPERVAGVDLVVELCHEAAAKCLSVYFLGGKPCSAKNAARRLSARFPGLTVTGIDCPPLGFENDHDELAAVVRRISEAAPDILFVAFGAPKQEYWMNEHVDSIPTVMIGVGCSFDVLSGELERAPLWMQNSGLEWAFRLSREPRRLWKRYLLGNAQFVKAVLWQWVIERKEAWVKNLRRCDVGAN